VAVTGGWRHSGVRGIMAAIEGVAVTWRERGRGGGVPAHGIRS